MKLFVVSAAVAGSAVLAASHAWGNERFWWAAEHPTALVVTLSTDSSTYRLGQPILVSIKETNVSDHPVAFVYTDVAIDYDLVVTDGAMTLTSVPGDARDSHPVTGNGQPFVLSPGQSVEELGLQGHASPLDAWGIHLTKPGTYHVTATLRFTNIKSNTVTIVVR